MEQHQVARSAGYEDGVWINFDNTPPDRELQIDRAALRRLPAGPATEAPRVVQDGHGFGHAELGGEGG